MRPWLVVGGLAVVGIGLALWWVNVPGPGSSEILTQSATTVQTEIVGSSVPLALLTEKVPYRLTWTTPGIASVVLRVFDCGVNSSCQNLNSSNPTARGTGSNGSLAWNGAKGEYFVIVPSGLSAGQALTVTVTFSAPLAGGLAGFALVLVGAPMTIAGAAIRRRAAPPA